MKTLFLLPLLLLAACGPSRQVASLNPEGWPVYCIRGMEVLGDGYVMIDMPGFYGRSRNDKPQRVSVETAESLNVPICAPTDPRMLESRDK